MSRGRFPKGFFKDRPVALVGMGRSNVGLARYLLREGAHITAFDSKSMPEMEWARNQVGSGNVSWRLGPGYLETLPSYPWIFLTPGMKKDLPEIQSAREGGATVTGEIDLLLDRCRCQVAAVTGSSGKTTTCTLIGMMLRGSDLGIPVYVGGNIGDVLIEQIDEIPQNAALVLELSSFQLETVSVSPRLAAVLNVSPNHLDVHGSYGDYVRAKRRIFRFQSPEDLCILNLDDHVTRGFSGDCPGTVGYFSLHPECAPYVEAPFCWADGDDVYLGLGEMSSFPGVSPAWALSKGPVAFAKRLLVPGRHNVSNFLAAMLLAAAMGATPHGVERAIRDFRGVTHRIEFVREVGGVRYYNDSIATSPDRTMALLDSIPGPLVLILGGYDKGLSFKALARRIVDLGVRAVTLGAAAPTIEEALLGAGGHEQDFVRAGTLAEAVGIARDLTREASGASVALSPACASYDMFKDYVERGCAFKEIVRDMV